MARGLLYIVVIIITTDLNLSRTSVLNLKWDRKAILQHLEFNTS